MITPTINNREFHDALDFHEVANIFPLIEGQEFNDLVEDIRINGLKQPIWIYQNKIIDGRNRYRACLRAGIEPQFQEWDGNGSLVAFTISLNVKRRHLTKSQLAIIAPQVEERFSLEAAERQKEAGRLYGENHSKQEVLPNLVKPLEPLHAAEETAKVLDVSKGYVIDAKRIAKQAPELIEHVKDGTLTIPDAKVIAELPAERRSAVIEKVVQRKEDEGKRVSGAVKQAIYEEEEGISTFLDIKRKLKEDEREQRRDENRQAIARAKTIDEVLGSARFSTIVIDPPWDWSDEGDVDQFGRARPTYGTMPFEELLKLPVEAHADEDCHLYLWITNRSLPKGFQLLETWGFRYVTCVTWIKPHFGMGNYFRGQTEHLLFGVRGSQMLKRKDAGTYFEAPRGPNGHSSKPLQSYDLIESCSPGPYLELFARSQRPDWTSWGAEA